MSQYFVLGTAPIFDEEGEEYDFVWLDPLSEADVELPWLLGVRFDFAPASPLRFRIELDDDSGAVAAYTSGPIPLITQQLRDALTQAGASNIDYYPVEVEGTEDYENFPTFFAMNVVGLVSAAGAGTVQRKTFGTDGANIIDRLAINERAAKGMPLFRLAEHLSTIVVSRKVKKACEAAGIDTLRFIPIDQWQT